MAEEIVIRLNIEPTSNNGYTFAGSNGTTLAGSNGANFANATGITANAAGVDTLASSTKCPDGLEYNADLKGCVYALKSASENCPTGMKPAHGEYKGLCVYNTIASCRPGTAFNEAVDGCVGTAGRYGNGNRPGWGGPGGWGPGWGGPGWGGGWGNRPGHRPGCGSSPGFPSYPIYPSGPRCPMGQVYNPMYNACMPIGQGGPMWNNRPGYGWGNYPGYGWGGYPGYGWGGYPGSGWGGYPGMGGWGNRPGYGSYEAEYTIN